MGEVRPVVWREATVVLMVCWVICGLAYGMLALWGEPGLPAAAPVVMFLAQ